MSDVRKVDGKGRIAVGSSLKGVEFEVVPDGLDFRLVRVRTEVRRVTG